MLLVDCGNSALKCRLLDGDTVEDRRFASTDQWGEFAEFARGLEVDRCYLASVSGEQVTQRVAGVLEDAPGIRQLTRLEVLPELGNLKNGYHDYRQLGVDRWLALLGAQALCDADALIIDAGSAITLDLLSAGSAHLGGAILPGFNTREERFRRFFPWVDFNDQSLWSHRPPGRSTAECIRMDGFDPARQQVFELARRWSHEFLEAPTVLLCGHDAPRVQPGVGENARIVPDLVFHGMLQQIRLRG